MTAEATAAAQRRAREYLHAKGTLAPLATIHHRVANAFGMIESLLEPVEASRAARVARPGEWSLHEIADHLVETDRPSLEELRHLLAGRRPPRGPVSAGLQSADPLARSWAALLRDMKEIHAEALSALATTRPDFQTEARAPVVMVINVPDASGAMVPVHWVEELDWKAYAIVLRVHTIDHTNQAKKVLAASAA